MCDSARPRHLLPISLPHHALRRHPREGWAQTFSVNPIFGVEFSVDEMPEKLERLRLAQEQDNVEIEDTDADDAADVFAAYFADGDKNADRDPVFSPELGLAIEGLREGTTVEQLWSVL